MRIKITSDSTCDLSPAQIAAYDITIIPLSVAMGGKDYRDGEDIVPADIYAHVSQGGELPKTAAVNTAQYLDLWSRFSGDYDAIIHFNISAEFSSCYQNACLAAQEMEHVYVVDSRNLSTGHGLLVLKAAELAAQGMDAAEIVRILQNSTDQVEASFVVNQLEYLKKGGRCSSVAALGANLLKLKPCIAVKDGKMGVEKKYRGAFDKCLQEYVKDRLKGRTDLDLSRVFVTHSGVDPQLVQLVVDAVQSLQPFQEICVTVAGCTVSSHCGPDTLGVLFLKN